MTTPTTPPTSPTAGAAAATAAGGTNQASQGSNSTAPAPAPVPKRLSCLRCSLWFYVADNHAEACHYHPFDGKSSLLGGRWGGGGDDVITYQFPTLAQFNWEKQVWSCCGKYDSPFMACRVGRPLRLSEIHFEDDGGCKVN